MKANSGFIELYIFDCIVSGALHGTAISLFQHGCDQMVDSNRSAVHYYESDNLSLKPLPHSYTTVPPVSVWNVNPSVPETTFDMSLNDPILLNTALERENMYVRLL